MMLTAASLTATLQEDKKVREFIQKDEGPAFVHYMKNPEDLGTPEEWHGKYGPMHLTPLFLLKNERNKS